MDNFNDIPCLIRQNRPIIPYVEGGSMIDVLVLGATGTPLQS